MTAASATPSPTAPPSPSALQAAAQRQRDADLIVRGIAWTSIAIGAAELLAPRRTRAAVSVGIAGWWMRLRGLRSIAGGVALLLSDRTTTWLHRRSIGHALDVVTLARGHGGGVAERARNAAAIAAIGGLTAVDLTAARMTTPQARLPAAAPGRDQRLNRG